MTLEDKINAEIKQAMLAKDTDKLTALRAIKAAILLLKTDKSGNAVTPEVEISLLQRLIKQRKEAADIYKSQNRDDLYNEEMNQVSVIETFLPEQISEDEVKQIIKRIISESGATSIKEMGKVIGLASKELAGKTENKTIANIVKELLNN
ncbi:MAG: GatB/YqeY domain-containing protein [Bacteroidales bacterium]|jgi:uncharacterized protein YqeY|nr:GatB/YqeY domain-containing protein [Bacteroidales bacterium]